MLFGYAMSQTALGADPRLAPPEEAEPLFVEIFVAGLGAPARAGCRG